MPADSPFFNQVESTLVNLNDGSVTRVENFEPYALFGDMNANYRGGVISLGNNTIVFDLYSKDGQQGELLGTVTRNFTLVNDLA
ncbi:MAG: hypothetical protein AAF704_18595 [Cyanobacteria bacterium P01_D01_bin.123]